MFGIAGSLIGDIWSRNPENLHMELALVSGIESTDVESPAYEVIGLRELNMSPAVLPDGTRRVYLVVTLSSGLAGVISNVVLWNATQGQAVTGTALNNSLAGDRTIPDTYTSAQLTEGVGAGHIRTNTNDEYELRLFRTGGTGGDIVTCFNAYIRVVFE